MDLPAPPIKRRSADDFERVYRRHFTSVWSTLSRLGVERADLEDAAQDVFLVAHRRRDAFTGESSMRTWLLGICRCVASDHRRRHRRHRRRVDRLRRQGPGVVEPDEALARREGAQHLGRFLRSLDEGKREIFVMVELEQLTGTEAARLLGINRNTAAARLRAARLALEDYAARVRRSTPRLLDEGRRRHAPDPATRRRVMGLVLARLADGGAGGAAPVVAASVVPTLKAVAISIAFAGVGLVGLRVGSESLRSRSVAETEEARATSPARPERSVALTDDLAPRRPAEPSHSPESTTAVSGARAGSHSLDHEPMDSGGPAIHASKSSHDTSAATADPLEVQSRALRRARAALRDGAPGDAIAVVDAIARDYPGGALAPELALVRIESLCAQGRVPQARGEARAFRRAYAGMPVAERAACPAPDGS